MPGRSHGHRPREEERPVVPGHGSRCAAAAVHRPVRFRRATVRRRPWRRRGCRRRRAGRTRRPGRARSPTRCRSRPPAGRHHGAAAQTGTTATTSQVRSGDDRRCVLAPPPRSPTPRAEATEPRASTGPRRAPEAPRGTGAGAVVASSPPACSSWSPVRRAPSAICLRETTTPVDVETAVSRGPRRERHDRRHHPPPAAGSALPRARRVHVRDKRGRVDRRPRRAQSPLPGGVDDHGAPRRLRGHRAGRPLRERWDETTVCPLRQGRCDAAATAAITSSSGLRRRPRVRVRAGAL